jgi:NADH-quinone oxidoreductase subunit N
VIRTPEIDLVPILPELVLCATAIVGLLYEAFARRSDQRLHVLVAAIGLAGAAAVSILLWNREGAETALQGMVAVDRYSVVARVLLIAIAAFALVYGAHYFARSGDEPRGEFYPLLLFATAGMTLITAANDLIVTFLALEILSLSLYVLTGITGRRGSSEAAMKYFLLGAFSSAFFLYGVAMAYGATGTTKIRAIANALTGSTGDLAIVLLAFAFLAVAFAFKVSSVPFHMWTPDVYQGAPTPVTAYMSAATKVAAFMALIRLLDVAFQPITWDWTPVIWVLAALSMIVGSVLAIAQSDVKRMLAYSSVAHAGFILTGLTAADQTGIRAALFYLIAYAIMTLGAFGIVMLVSARGEEQTSFGAYAGLARRSPLLAGLMTLFLLSLAGIPPTVGFIAKAGVFGAAIGAGHWPLALIGVVSSVVAAFFYLRLIVVMYLQDPQGEHVGDASVAPRVAIAIPAALVLVLGVFPGLLSDILQQASVLRW